MLLDLADEQNPLVGARGQLALEIGMFTTATDADGNVTESGIDLVVAPQIGGALLVGANERGRLRALTQLELGAAPKLVVPFGPHVGLIAGLFVGATRTALSGPADSNGKELARG